MKSEELIDIEDKFNKVFGSDYEKDSENKENKYSIEENNWIEYVEENTVQLPNGHYQIKLPFKENVKMHQNYHQVLGRFKGLTARLQKDENMCKEYSKFMNETLDNDFMEKVPQHKITCRQINVSICATTQLFTNRKTI